MSSLGSNVKYIPIAMTGKLKLRLQIIALGILIDLLPSANIFFTKLSLSFQFQYSEEMKEYDKSSLLEEAVPPLKI